MSPLTPEQRRAYGPNWPATSREVRARSEGRCECQGECGWVRHLDWLVEQGIAPTGRCPAINGRPSPLTRSRVVLTVAHLDRNAGAPGHDNPDRLRALCQGCHLSYDRRATTT